MGANRFVEECKAACVGEKGIERAMHFDLLGEPRALIEIGAELAGVHERDPGERAVSGMYLVHAASEIAKLKRWLRVFMVVAMGIDECGGGVHVADVVGKHDEELAGEYVKFKELVHAKEDEKAKSAS